MITGPVLVTGGSGMLGHALLEELDQRRVKDVLAPTRAELDLCDANRVAEYWAEHSPRTVFHLAGYVRGILGNMTAGTHALLVNAEIQTNLLRAAIAEPPNVFLVAGTVAAYAYPYARLPLIEEDFWQGSPHSSEGYYAAGKRVAIPYLEALTQMGSTSIFTILTNLFGPHDHFGQPGSHVVPSLIPRFVSGADAGLDAVEVWGRPDTTRDFLYSRDAARYMCDLVDSPGARGRFTCVNVASGRETTMGQLAAALSAVTGFSGDIAWNETAPIGIPRRSMSTRLLQQHVRSSPMELQDALAETVSWYRDSLQP